MSLDEAKKDTDVLKEVDGINFIVDVSFEDMYEVIKVDYGTQYFRKGYIIGLERDED